METREGAVEGSMAGLRVCHTQTLNESEIQDDATCVSSSQNALDGNVLLSETVTGLENPTEATVARGKHVASNPKCFSAGNGDQALIGRSSGSSNSCSESIGTIGPSSKARNDHGGPVNCENHVDYAHDYVDGLFCFSRSLAPDCTISPSGLESSIDVSILNRDCNDEAVGSSEAQARFDFVHCAGNPLKPPATKCDSSNVVEGAFDFYRGPSGFYNDNNDSSGALHTPGNDQVVSSHIGQDTSDKVSCDFGRGQIETSFLDLEPVTVESSACFLDHGQRASIPVAATTHVNSDGAIKCAAQKGSINMFDSSVCDGNVRDSGGKGVDFTYATTQYAANISRPALACTNIGSRMIKSLFGNEMDPKLWSQLADHILDRVFTFLPFWCIFRIRRICKMWNKHLAGRSFMDRCSRPSAHNALFIMSLDFSRLKVAAAYNPTLNKWHLIPLAYFFPGEPVKTFNILATASGLVCFEDEGWPDRALFVSNPINRTHKKLPPMLPMENSYVVGMIMDEDGKGYRILVAQDGESLVSQYYESCTNCWKMNMTLDRRAALIAGAVYQGLLVCLTIWPVGLIAYNIKEASWVDLNIKMPISVVSPHVMEFNEQLLLLGGLEEFGQLRSIKLWKIDLACRECIELERMPDYLFRKLTFSGQEHFFSVVQGGLICFYDGLTANILMHSMVEKRWWWLPPCPLFHYQILGFSIRPRFDLRADVNELENH